MCTRRSAMCKKLLAALLAVTTTLGLFGCGGNEEAPTNEGNMTVSYTSTFSVNDLVVTVESSTPIDKTKVRKLLEQVYYEEITYNDMVSQLKGMGYTVK